MIRRLLAILLAALPAMAPAQYIAATNDVLWLNPATRPLRGTLYRQIQYDVTARRTTNAVDLTGYSVQMEIYDGSQTGPVQTIAGTLLDATNGQIRVTWIPAALVDGWAQIVTVPASPLGRLAWDYLTVTQACTSCASSGGGGDVSVIITAPVEVAIATAPGPTSINGATTGGVTIATEGYGIRIVTNGNVITAVSDIAYPSPGVAQILQFDGASNYWGAFGSPDPLASIGTNVGKMWLPWPATNSFNLESTNMLIELWGATGGESSGAGAYVKAGLTRLPVGTPINVVIGTGGYGSDRATTNSKPFGGSGYNYSGTQSNRAGGGGMTVAFIGELIENVTTNIIAIAPGGGGGAYQSGLLTAVGAPGGSIYQGGSSGYVTADTNIVAGVAPWASTVFGDGVQTSVAPFEICQGVGFQGGHYYRFAADGRMGGGGAGYIGGNGACSTGSLVSSTAGASGSAGLPWINTNFCTWGEAVRGAYNSGVAPPGSDSPGYTSGRGVGSSGASAGSAGCAARRW